ncbi:Actin-like 6A [Tyrophagus putrescentiae]|nr:Actin-like 6A [Tyrophagus putrescentiae]
MTNVSDEVGAVVMDIGSHSIKVGYAGEARPPRSEITTSSPCTTRRWRRRLVDHHERSTTSTRRR